MFLFSLLAKERSKVTAKKIVEKRFGKKAKSLHLCTPDQKRSAGIEKIKRKRKKKKNLLKVFGDKK
jgi:hypothetical protein